MVNLKKSLRNPSLLIALSLALLIALILTTFSPAYAATFGDSSFEKIWQQSDGPVAAGQANRSWLWGQTVWVGYEGYDQAKPNANRMVEYFDKARMEINDPNADRNSQWFVSNGLLTLELVSGKMQVGDSRFEDRAPAAIPVAGDLTNNPGPTYAALAGLTTAKGNFAPNRTGQSVNQGVNGSGNVSQVNAPVATTYAYYEGATQHNIPAVLWSWMQNIPGSNWTFALGYPISEAYWSTFNVGGQSKQVLVQLFQRRILTYTPSNPAGWQVEMGNIGLHYFNWRYNGKAPAPVQVASASAGVASTGLDGEEQTFLNLVNNYRKANGLTELAYQPQLQSAADWLTRDMGDKNYFSHTDSLGRDPFKRMAGEGYQGGWMGENIAAGKGTAQDVFNQFKNSPAHNANMLKPEYKKLGISRYYRSGSTYGWYWTVDFGDK